MDTRPSDIHGTVKVPSVEAKPKRATKADVAKAQKAAAKVEAQHEATVKKLAGQIVTDPKQLSAQIDTLQKDVTKLGVRMHLLAAGCCIHAIQHGDVTLARRFVIAISGGDNGQTVIRTNAYRNWFMTYGPFRTKQEGDKDEGRNLLFLDSKRRAELSKEYKKLGKAKFGGKLMSETPEGLTPEPEWKGFDFQEEFKKLIDRAESYETNQVKRMQKAGKTVTAKMRNEIDLHGITEAKKALAVIEGEGGRRK